MNLPLIVYYTILYSYALYYFILITILVSLLMLISLPGISTLFLIQGPLKIQFLPESFQQTLAHKSFPPFFFLVTLIMYNASFNTRSYSIFCLISYGQFFPIIFKFFKGRNFSLLSLFKSLLLLLPLQLFLLPIYHTFLLIFCTRMLMITNISLVCTVCQ